jgi:RNA polymerase sigma factor (sigma-70 family)
MPLNKLIIESSDPQDDSRWLDVKSGDRDAFVHFYNKYADDLLRYGFHLVRDKALVEDAIHDLFVSIWDKKEKSADVNSVKFYLLSALRRILLRKVKKERVWQTKNSNFYDITSISPSFLESTIEIQDEAELIQKVQTALSKLSSRQKEIIYLKFYQNLSYSEISELMGLDQKYTYNLASRAFANFREQFGKLGSLILLYCLSSY